MCSISIAADGAFHGVERAVEPIRGARILLVEDNEINQQVASEMLRGAGFEVEWADNGPIAVERINERFAQGRPYDLVLMDMQMPVMDGVTASRHIRQRYSAEQLPVVAMTAHAAADRERCMTAGMNGCVTKPIQPDALWHALLTWIRMRPGLGAAAPLLRQDHDDVSAGAIDALMGHLRRIQDLDVDAGQMRTMNRPAFYASMLRRFVASQGSATERIRQSIAVADFAGAEIIAHTLRSVAASLGAGRLQHSAEKLESALRSGAGTDALAAALSHSHTLLESLMQALLHTPGLMPVERPAAMDCLSAQERAMALATLEKIKVRLACDDAGAVELWEANAPMLRALLVDCPGVEAAIAGFDFEAALACLAPFGPSA